MKAGDIKMVGVVGGGVMGSGIVESAMVAGYKTFCRDLTDDILKRTRETIVNGRFGIMGGIERGKLTKEQAQQAIANLVLTTKMEDLRNCDIVIEAVGNVAGGELENKDIKLKILSDLDKIVKKEAIFTTNTSYFTIADLAKATHRKERVMGTHFFRPPYILKAVEVIWTADNPEDVIQTVEGFCRSMGKVPIRVRDIPGDTGFVGNRLYRAYAAEAQRIVEDGVATPKQVDDIMKLGYGWTLGPFEMGAGLQDYRKSFEGK